MNVCLVAILLFEALVSRSGGKIGPIDNILVITKILSVLAANTPLLAAVASPRRREILRLVWDGERAAGDIHRAMPDVTFGAVSLQLRALVRAGLVESRAQGRHRLYRARRDALGSIGTTLEGMWSDALWRLKLQAELVDTRRGPGAARVKARPATSGTKERTS
jgi:DNA-binding transcriptional ArsR family regulator